MDSSRKVIKSEELRTKDVEVEMLTEAVIIQDDGGKHDDHQYTNLMPMEHYEESLDALRLTSTIKPSSAEQLPTLTVAKLNLSISESETEIDEVLPDDGRKGGIRVGSQKEEEIIHKILDESLTFSEVAQFFDSDASGSEPDEPEASTSKSHIVEDHAKEFGKELEEQQRFHLKRKSKHEKRRRRRLPPALKGLMGEANLRYARNEYEDAIKMCMEVIRQHPHGTEPYQLLGMIYEEQNMTSKSLQYLLIAAFLSPDAAEWEKLADISLYQLNDIQQAVFCLGRAIKANPRNLDYHLLRCDLLKSLGENKEALKGYMNMLKFLDSDQGEKCLELAKHIAKIHYENGELLLAQQAMETAFRKFPIYVGPEDINLMMELMMHRQLFVESIEILVNHIGIVFEGKTSELNSSLLEDKIIHATSVIVPDGFVVDLRAKLIICLIHLKAFDLAESMVQSLFKEPIDEFGDLYLEVAEAYSKTERCDRALSLLRPLLDTDQYNVAAVWLLYGECLHKCNKISPAVEAYTQVVSLAPQHSSARLVLSSLYKSLNKHKEALKVLDQDASFPLNSLILIQLCRLIQEQIDRLLVDKKNSNIGSSPRLIALENNYIEAVKLLLGKHFVDIRSFEEADILLTVKKISNKLELLRDLREASDYEEYLSYTGEDAPMEEQWDMFIKICQILYTRKRFIEFERLTFSALGSRDFLKDKEKTKDMEFLCLLACIGNHSFHFAYNIVREMVMRNPFSKRCWNLLALVISKADDFRHNRFLLRLTHKYPESLPLWLLNGHNCLVSGTYKFSLADYTQAFKQDDSNPLIPLMLGITFTHMACQKFSGKKHALVIQASGFLDKYLKLRGKCQESYYNLGRAMHQLSLLPQAIFYYKQAISLSTAVPSDPNLDLSKEIAFNLSVIYKSSGNDDMAKLYINKYIQI